MSKSKRQVSKKLDTTQFKSVADKFMEGHSSRKTIVIAPFARFCMQGEPRPNPKDYPYWKEVVVQLNKEYKTVQVGLPEEEDIGCEERWNNMTFPELLHLLTTAGKWVSVDNMVQHFAWYHGIKGIVIFSQSDPNIFGHDTNINLLKDRKYLRQNRFQQGEDGNWVNPQFDFWSSGGFNAEAFIAPDVLIDEINKYMQ